jgi:hypothetical protein
MQLPASGSFYALAMLSMAFKSGIATVRFGSMPLIKSPMRWAVLLICAFAGRLLAVHVGG